MHHTPYSFLYQTKKLKSNTEIIPNKLKEEISMKI